MYLIPAITAALAIRYLGRNKSLDIPVTLGERLTDLRDRLMTRFSRAGSTPAGGSGTP